MPPRPSISVRRPSRTGDVADPPCAPIAPSAIPEINPEAAEAVAFSMRGRASGADPTITPPSAPLALERVRTSVPGEPLSGAPVAAPKSPISQPGIEPEASEGFSTENESGYGLISIKLPPDVGRQLAAIADRRGSKRTLIAIEALTEPLRALAAAHRAGEFQDLPKIVSGSVRSSLAFALPDDLAADLAYVLKTRRAVRAQVITRLLAPAVRALYDAEVGRRGR